MPGFFISEDNYLHLLAEFIGCSSLLPELKKELISKRKKEKKESLWFNWCGLIKQGF